VVCDVNSEKERLQVIFSVFKKIEGDFGNLAEELALCHRPKTEKNE
jgi:hypothetical protein